MPPRIRSFFSRPPYVREAKAPPKVEAPRVFREFVETLQRLDGAARPEKRQREQSRKRGYIGNGHKRPKPLRARSRTK